jgi:ligand-binding sensor domain-containing protein
VARVSHRITLACRHQNRAVWLGYPQKGLALYTTASSIFF